MDKMIIGDNIKRLRQIYDLSQKDLANIAGVTNKAVSAWETGVKEPRMGAIQKIADHFGFKKSNIIEKDGLNNIQAICEYAVSKKDSNLSQEDVDFLRRFHALPPTGQHMLVNTLSNLEEMFSEPSAIKEDLA